MISMVYVSRLGWCPVTKSIDEIMAGLLAKCPTEPKQPSHPELEETARRLGLSLAEQTRDMSNRDAYRALSFSLREDARFNFKGGWITANTAFRERRKELLRMKREDF